MINPIYAIHVTLRVLEELVSAFESLPARLAPFIEEPFSKIFVSLGLICQNHLLGRCSMWLEHSDSSGIQLPCHLEAFAIVCKLASPSLLFELIQVHCPLSRLINTANPSVLGR